jgi:glucosamine--fructose-6-phosphate aminotransferase (isomerizing)
MLLKVQFARDSNFVLPIHCGPEIGVASTKAFLGQILYSLYVCFKIRIIERMKLKIKSIKTKLKI